MNDPITDPDLDHPNGAHPTCFVFILLLFYSNCIKKLVGADSKCPECGAFAWVKDMKTNRQLVNTVNMCAKIRMLVGSNDDSDNNRNKAHASNDKKALVSNN